LLATTPDEDVVAERCFDGDRLSPIGVAVVVVACSRSGEDGSTTVAGSTADSPLYHAITIITVIIISKRTVNREDCYKGARGN